MRPEWWHRIRDAKILVRHLGCAANDGPERRQNRRPREGLDDACHPATPLGKISTERVKATCEELHVLLGFFVCGGPNGQGRRGILWVAMILNSGTCRRDGACRGGGGRLAATGACGATGSGATERGSRRETV